MSKPLSENEMADLRPTVGRMASPMTRPHVDVVNGFLDSVLPRMVVTIDTLRAENKRLSEKLADEILDAENIGAMDRDLEDPDYSWPVIGAFADTWDPSQPYPDEPGPIGS